MRSAYSAAVQQRVVCTTNASAALHASWRAEDSQLAAWPHPRPTQPPTCPPALQRMLKGRLLVLLFAVDGFKHMGRAATAPAAAVLHRRRWCRRRCWRRRGLLLVAGRWLLPLQHLVRRRCQGRHSARVRKAGTTIPSWPSFMVQVLLPCTATDPTQRIDCQNETIAAPGCLHSNT